MKIDEPNRKFDRSQRRAESGVKKSIGGLRFDWQATTN
jgi:hypothetical protein